MKNLLNISDLDRNSLESIINNEFDNNIEGKNIGLIFEKCSTRTRLSFTVGISHLKGNPIDIRFEELNISRDETFEDTFRAINCYIDGLIYRTNSHDKLIKASKYFSKPIINALSDQSHPCQIISDLYTLKEHFGSLSLNLLWIGDMNNVCYSFIEAANIIEEIKLTICTPSELDRSSELKISENINIENQLSNIELESIDCVMTDVFISMNDKKNDNKIKLLKPYTVNDDLMLKTKDQCIFMHCLPAKIGFEVTKSVIESRKSIVWKQAYNRLVAQKKLIQYIFS